jgi:hypothetical protein
MYFLRRFLYSLHNRFDYFKAAVFQIQKRKEQMPFPK